LTPSPPSPSYVTDLVAIYGPPSQAGFGSAVFFEQLDPEADLAQVAQGYYRYFVGDLWERYGEAAWMTPWKQVYSRQPGGRADIVTELNNLPDPQVKLSVQLLLEPNGQDEQARQVLAAVYDAPSVTELRVYTVGDGAAMSGLFIAARRQTGETTMLVFLLD
jgi:hypothetical protein